MQKKYVHKLVWYYNNGETYTEKSKDTITLDKECVRELLTSVLSDLPEVICLRYYFPTGEVINYYNTFHPEYKRKALSRTPNPNSKTKRQRRRQIATENYFEYVAANPLHWRNVDTITQYSFWLGENV